MQRAETEEVDLEQREVFEIVFVPLDHGAAGHRGVLDRDDVVDRFVTEEEAARVNADVARELEDLVGQAREVLDRRGAVPRVMID